MKVTIEYLKTGHIEKRENVSEIKFFGKGRIVIESEKQTSVFWPDDNVGIEIVN